jgi:hypothetical protein
MLKVIKSSFKIFKLQNKKNIFTLTTLKLKDKEIDFIFELLGKESTTSTYERKTKNENEMFNKITGSQDYDSYKKILDIELIGSNPITPIDSLDAIKDIDPQLLKNIKRADFKELTPVQKYSIPVIMAKRDLMVSSQVNTKNKTDRPVQEKHFRFCFL